MSIRALAWAMDGRLSGPMPTSMRALLMVMADGADSTGRGSHMSARTLAARLTITERQVLRLLAQLEAAGLIRDGDQRLVDHIPLDRRPVVRDLALATVMPPEPGGVTAMAPRTEDAPKPVDNPARGDIHDAHGVTSMSPKPSTNPKRSTHLPYIGDPDARETEASASHRFDPATWTPARDEVSPAVSPFSRRETPEQPREALELLAGALLQPEVDKERAQLAHEVSAIYALDETSPEMRGPATLAHAVPREPGAPIRSIGNTGRECPTCGAPIYRSHRCRKSAMDPDKQPPTNVTPLPVAVLPGQYPLPIPVPDCTGRTPCAWCGRTTHVNTDGVCLRCLVDVTRMGPHHPNHGDSA